MNKLLCICKPVIIIHKNICSLHVVSTTEAMEKQFLNVNVSFVSLSLSKIKMRLIMVEASSYLSSRQGWLRYCGNKWENRDRPFHVLALTHFSKYFQFIRSSHSAKLKYIWKYWQNTWQILCKRKNFNDWKDSLKAKFTCDMRVLKMQTCRPQIFV